MEIRIRYIEKDYLHYAFSHIRKWRSKYYPIVLLGACLILGVPTFLGALRSEDRFLYSLSVILIFLVVFYLLVLILYYFRAKQEFKSNQFMKHEVHYSFNENGFTANTSISHADMVWSNVLKVTQSAKIFALYVSRNTAYLFPKDQLNSEQHQYLEDLYRKYKTKTRS
jgi:hypothetical protein